MQAVAPIPGGCFRIQALIWPIQGISKQWRAQLGEVNADLMRAASRDRHMQEITVGMAFHHRDFRTSR